ncbi:MAG: type 4a pilus biogenesis protein PilO [Proteobacteria bacterium]|nr:type 4a pilus biogenesis protein PilO [Pseudomonadota bacterium]
MIYPNYRALLREEATQQQLAVEIKKQEILAPVYKELLKRGRFDFPDNLPRPETAPLPRRDVGRLSQVFKELAEKNRLELEDIITYPPVTENGVSRMDLDLKVKGEYQALRQFLIELAAWPSLERIVRFQVDSSPENMSCGLKLWLKLE